MEQTELFLVAMGNVSRQVFAQQGPNEAFWEELQFLCHSSLQSLVLFVCFTEEVGMGLYYVNLYYELQSKQRVLMNVQQPI